MYSMGKVEQDSRFLEICLKFASFLGIIPISNRRIITATYVVLLNIVFISIDFLVVHPIHEAFLQRKRYFASTFLWSMYIIRTIFQLNGLFCSLRYGGLYQKIMENLSNAKGYTKDKDNTCLRKSLIVIALYIVVVFIGNIKIIAMPKRHHNLYNSLLFFSEISMRISRIFVITVIMSEFTSLMSRRFKMSFLLLENAKAMPPNIIVVRLKILRNKYAELYQILDSFNTYFGTFLLYIFCLSVSETLDTFNIIIRVFKFDGSEDGNKLLVYGLPSTMIGSVLSVAISFFCDKIDVIGDKSATRCFTVQREGNKWNQHKELRRELSDLSTYFRDMSPKITAMGLFTVNRRFLLGFVSALTAYIIIIIQFNQFV